MVSSYPGFVDTLDFCEKKKKKLGYTSSGDHSSYQSEAEKAQ